MPGASVALAEARRGATVVCLVPARTDTLWWHEYVMRASEVRLIRGRLSFVGAKSAAPFPSAIVVFGPGGDSDCPKFVSMARARIAAQAQQPLLRGM